MCAAFRAERRQSHPQVDACRIAPAAGLAEALRHPAIQCRHYTSRAYRASIVVSRILIVLVDVPDCKMFPKIAHKSIEKVGHVVYNNRTCGETWGKVGEY